LCDAAPALLLADDEGSDADEGSAFGDPWDAMQNDQAGAVIGEQHTVVGPQRPETMRHFFGGSRIAQLSE
jgi:hypothetical protein